MKGGSPMCYICWTPIDSSIVNLPEIGSYSLKRIPLHKRCADYWIINSPSFKTLVGPDVYKLWYFSVSDKVKEIMDKREITRIISTEPSFICTTPDCPFVCTFSTECNQYSRFRCPSCKILQRVKTDQIQSQDALQYKTGFRQCPTCKTIIEKTEGCSNMSCSVCGTIFYFEQTVRNPELTKNDSFVLSELLGIEQ